MTLLELVTSILAADMDGDEVISIYDTEESEQVARNVIAAFNNIVATRDWLHTQTLLQLTPLSNSDLPTYFVLPSNIKKLNFINYDVRQKTDDPKSFREIKYKEPDHFLAWCNARKSNDANVQEVSDPSGVELLISTNAGPTYYTSFDETHIIMDSYDSNIDSTLQESKTQAQAFVVPTLEMQDDAYIDLPDEALPLLRETATARAQLKVRQFVDRESKEEAGRQSRYMARNQWRVKGGVTYPNYGRKK